MKIAIYTSDFNWAGGVDLLHGMVKGLLAQTKQRCEIFILVHNPSFVEAEPPIYKVLKYAKIGLSILKKPAKLKETNLFNKFRPVIQDKVSGTPADYSQIENINEIFFHEAVQIVYYANNSKELILNKLADIKADVILPILNNVFPANYPIPWVGYLFDFVYKYHSHLYTKDFCLVADINYATTLLNAKSVVVNSKATYDDVYKYFPYAKAKVYHMPFAPYTNEFIYKAAASNDQIKKDYNIHHPYFIISNQFWLHKSHETAFAALRILREDPKYANIEIICTGRMTDLSGTDSRKLELLSYLEKLNLKNYVHFIGHISKVDQLALMLRSVSVIQPTLFEGGPGGGSVYMAIANGIPAIVSDIPVNKEIGDEKLVTFFEALNPDDLAEKMVSALTIKSDKILPYTVLHERNNKRLNELGNTLIECINNAIN